MAICNAYRQVARRTRPSHINNSGSRETQPNQTEEPNAAPIPFPLFFFDERRLRSRLVGLHFTSEAIFVGLSSMNSFIGGAEAVLLNRLAKWLPCESMFLGARGGARRSYFFLAPSHTKAPFGRASPAASGAVWSRFLPNGVK